jgi:hypothetical protein
VRTQAELTQYGLRGMSPDMNFVDLMQPAKFCIVRAPRHPDMSLGMHPFHRLCAWFSPYSGRLLVLTKGTPPDWPGDAGNTRAEHPLFTRAIIVKRRLSTFWVRVPKHLAGRKYFDDFLLIRAEH